MAQREIVFGEPVTYVAYEVTVMTDTWNNIPLELHASILIRATPALRAIEGIRRVEFLPDHSGFWILIDLSVTSGIAAKAAIDAVLNDLVD